MTIPLQFASLYQGQEVFMWSDCLLDLGTDFRVSNVVFVRDALQTAVNAGCANSSSVDLKESIVFVGT